MSVTTMSLKMDKKKHHGIDVSPTGAVAVFSGRVCTVWIDMGRTMEPLIGLEPFTGPISKVSWCRGPETTSETPMHLMLADTTGQATLINVVNQRTLCTFSILDGYVTAIEWSKMSANKVLIGTSQGKVALYHVEEQIAEVMWTVDVAFRVDFLHASPFDRRKLVVANKTGACKTLKVLRTAEVTGSGTFEEPIVDIQFHAHTGSSLAVVSTRNVSILFPGSKSLIIVPGEGNELEDLYGAYFADDTKEDAILFVYGTHARFRQLEADGTYTVQHFRILAPMTRGRQHVVDTYFASGKFYVVGCDNTLTVYALRRGKFWAVQVARGVSKVKKFDVIDNTIAFGCRTGILATTGVSNDGANTSSIKKFMRVCRGEIGHIVAVDSCQFIVTTFEGNKQRVLFVDLKNCTTISLLKPSLELVSVLPVSISVSLSRDMIAIIAASSTLLLYHLDDSGVRLVKTVVSESTGMAVGVFAENSREFWLMSPNMFGRVFAIDLTDERNPVVEKRMSNLNHGQALGRPVVCVCACNRILVGCDNGMVAFLSWDEAPMIAMKTRKAIDSVALSSDNQWCVVKNAKGSVSFVNMVTFQILKTAAKCGDVRFNSSSSVLTRVEHCLSMKHMITFEPIHVPHCDSMNKALFSGTADERISGFLEEAQGPMLPDELAVIARKWQFEVIAVLIETLGDKLVASALCANFTKERMENYLRSISRHLRKSPDEDMRREYMRNLIILGDITGVFDLLISTPPTSPAFGLNMVKSLLIDGHSDPRTRSPSIAALVAADQSHEAIDIQLLVKDFSEAVRLVLGDGLAELAIQLVLAKIPEDDHKAAFGRIEQCLVSSGRTENAVAMYMARHMFEDAARLLDTYRLPFASRVIRSIKFEDGKVRINASPLHEKCE